MDGTQDRRAPGRIPPRQSQTITIQAESAFRRRRAEILAEEVGCSTFYLSRIFAQETGASIPKFLRMKRIEKAAELLRTGRMNVTEAAFTVGYSSLSAFNKAFVEQMGCCPGLYPKVPIAGRRAKSSGSSG